MKFASSKISVIIASALLPFAAVSKTYEIKFYEGISAGSNLYANYQDAGVGTFEIADSAIAPDSLVLFTDPAFKSFDVSLNTIYGSAQFTKGVDAFPGDHFHALTGLLFDNNAEPLRFEDPNSAFHSVGTYMCDPDCVTGDRDWLALQDNNSFDVGYLSDGSIIVPSLLNPGASFTRLGGTWSFHDGQVKVTHTGNYLQISAVPIPAALPLFVSALGFLGFAGWKCKKST